VFPLILLYLNDATCLEAMAGEGSWFMGFTLKLVMDALLQLTGVAVGVILDTMVYVVLLLHSGPGF